MDRQNLTKQEREKYDTICEVLMIAKYIYALHPDPIKFVPESDKYKGWRGTMKPSY